MTEIFINTSRQMFDESIGALPLYHMLLLCLYMIYMECKYVLFEKLGLFFKTPFKSKANSDR